MAQLIFPSISFESDSSTLALTGTSAKLFLNRSFDVNAGVLKVTDGSGASLTASSTDFCIDFAKQSRLDFDMSTAKLFGKIFTDGQKDKIILDGNKNLNVLSGIVRQQVIVSGKGNVISGMADFEHPIILQDSESEVTLNLKGKLTNDIIMNSGTIHLASDLRFKDDVQFLGSGNVQVNNFSIFFPASLSKPLSGNINFYNANDVTIETRTVLTGIWFFIGSTSHLKGTGVILDISSGGLLYVGQNTYLYVNGVHIKGLGSSGGDIIMSNRGSRMFFTETILELAGDYVLDRGYFIFEGAFCKIIFTYGDSLYVDSANATLIVDGQLLEYDSRGDPEFASPIKTSNSGVVSIINGGRIQSSFYSTSSNSSVFNPLQSVNLTYTQTSLVGTNFIPFPVDLGTSSSITFQNLTPSTSVNMVFDGLGNSLKFDDNLSQPGLIVGSNISLTVQNIKIINFDLNKISLQGSGVTQAKIIFGDGVTLGIEKNLTLGSNSILCTGNVSFFGYGKPSLSLTSSSIIFSPTSTATISFRGLVLNFGNYNSLVNTSQNCNVILHNTDLKMSSTGFTFDRGSLFIKDSVGIYSFYEKLTDGQTPFNFTSSGLLTVMSGAVLDFSTDVIFVYSPDVSQDGGIFSVQKRHLRMSDPSSLLSFKKSFLLTKDVGMALDYGKILINDIFTLNTGIVPGQEFELGSGVNTTILNNGIFNVEGLLKYVPTVYP